MAERHQSHIQHETTGEGVVVLSLHGDVDIYSALAFKEALLGVIDAGADRVLIDLTAAPFIDSTGLGVLVSGAKKARRGAIAIVCADAATRRIFDVVGFDHLFAVYDTRAGALGASVPEGQGHAATLAG